MSETVNLGLPLLQSAQAQKHVTHNEALALLDAVVQLAILSRSLATPPATPAEGDHYLISGPSTGIWSGHAGHIAFFQDGGWRFAVPKPGWRAWCVAESKMIVFNGTAWADFGAPTELQNMTLVGVNATADAANKLTVSSAGVLFTHAGSDQRLKLNKNAAANTASVLFQDGFSGRAEFGLAGDDNFHLKVSPDGSAWTEALTIDRTTGVVAAPQGLAGNTVNNAQLADMAAGRIKGAVTAGDPADLTGTQVTTLLDTFTAAAKGLAPASGGGTANYLRADGTWATPAGGTGEANTASNVNVGGVGVFKQKTGVNLEFRGINAGSTKVTVTSDAANNEIDIDVAEANLTLSSLGGSIDLGSAKASGTLAAARFPAHTGDVTNTAGSLALSIGAGVVSNAKLASVAAGTLKGRSSAGAGVPEDLTATQATALLDAFTPALKGLAPASGGGTTNFLRADGSWAAPPGGSGGTGDVVGPAGATDNALARFDTATGKLLQNSAAALDDTGVLSLPQAAVPALPASGALKFFVRDLGGRPMPDVQGPAGTDTILQPHIARGYCGVFRPAGNSTTVNLLGVTNSASGTAAARNVATSNLFQAMKRIGFVSAATAGSSAGTRNGVLQQFRGNAANLGGFHFVARFGISDSVLVSGSRLFVGLYGTATAIGNVDPSTLLNMIGVGADAADTVLQIMSNDGTGVATRTSLGASFPANTINTDTYELVLYCASNSAQVTWRVERLNTGDVATGTISADLPAATTLLAPQLWRNNGTTAAAVGLDVMSWYIEFGISDMARNSLQDIGELRARIAAVEAEMQGLRHDVREIRDTLIGLRGGWRLLTIVIAISATLGAAMAKVLPALMWPRL